MGCCGPHQMPRLQARSKASGHPLSHVRVQFPRSTRRAPRGASPAMGPEPQISHQGGGGKEAGVPGGGAWSGGARGSVGDLFGLVRGEAFGVHVRCGVGPRSPEHRRLGHGCGAWTKGPGGTYRSLPRGLGGGLARGGPWLGWDRACRTRARELVAWYLGWTPEPVNGAVPHVLTRCIKWTRLVPRLSVVSHRKRESSSCPFRRKRHSCFAEQSM